MIAMVVLAPGGLMALGVFWLTQSWAMAGCFGAGYIAALLVAFAVGTGMQS